MIRLARFGARKQPYYRVVVIEKDRARNSRSIEVVGTYNPRTNPASVLLKKDRIEHWTKTGAQVSERVAFLVKNVAGKVEADHPSTGKLLERTETKIASDSDDQQVPIGTVTWRQTITATSVVPDVATRPDGTRLDTSRWTICGADPQAGNPDQGHCVDP